MKDDFKFRSKRHLPLFMLVAAAGVGFCLSLPISGLGFAEKYEDLQPPESYLPPSVAVERNVQLLKEEVEKERHKVSRYEKELEEEKRPILHLEFEDKQPPFKVKAESEISFVFRLKFTRGDVARDTRVFFFAPAGFQFLDSPLGPAGVGKYSKCVSTEFNCENIVRPMIPRKRVKFKAPPTPSTYTASYGIVCEGYSSGYTDFEIVVRGKGSVIK